MVDFRTLSWRRAIPLSGWRDHLLCLLLGLACALLLQLQGATGLDRWVYDHALTRSERPLPVHTRRVVVDQAIPLTLSREQMWPLFALASERALQLGAQGVVIDGVAILKSYRRQVLAACIETGGAPRWCQFGVGGQCDAGSGPRQAPLAWQGVNAQQIWQPPPLSIQQPPPWPQLFGSSPLPRFFNPQAPMSSDGLLRELSFAPDSLAYQLGPPAHGQVCLENELASCLPIRYSQAARPLALSQLAGCALDPQLKAELAGRWLIVQLTGDEESTDVHMRPDAQRGAVLWPGARILQDGLETLLANDAPRRPPSWLALSITLSLSGLGLLLIGRLSFGLALLSLSALALLGLALITWAYPYIVVPASVWLAALLGSALATLARVLWQEGQRGALAIRYVPAPVRRWLTRKGTAHYVDRSVQATILLSDLANYTPLSEQLKDCRAIFALLNAYLQEVSLALQDHYGGWLEAYVGDMICYYWPELENETQTDPARIIAAAIDLAARQQAFFSKLRQQLALPEHLRVDAGIALVRGRVMLGELGPPGGVRHFGIIGDPINLAARIEALSRHFTAHLLLDETLASYAQGHPLRRLCRVIVKGRSTPVTLYALHLPHEAIDAASILAWELWLDGGMVAGRCPPIWDKDSTTLLSWCRAGWWDDEKKCFRLSEK